MRTLNVLLHTLQHMQKFYYNIIHVVRSPLLDLLCSMLLSDSTLCWDVEKERGGGVSENNTQKNSDINLITVNLHYRWPNAYCCASERCHSIQFDYGAPVVFMYVCNGCKIPSPQTKLYQVINVDHFPKTKQKGNISQ